jgi:hypothetical protein
MDTEEGSVGPQLFGRDGKVDGLQQHVGRGTRLGLGCPMSESASHEEDRVSQVSGDK